MNPEKIKPLKKIFYKIVPREFRIILKRIYYRGVLSPMYNLRNWKVYGRYYFFDSISIETTTYCNLRCRLCPNSKYERGLLKNKKLMDINLFKKIINELAEIDFQGEIGLTHYGEPLSDERMPDFVGYVRKTCPKSFININSNGFFLTIPLYNKLVENGLDSLSISQYGSSIQPNYKKVMDYLKKNPQIKNVINYRIFDGKEGSDAVSNRGGEIEIERFPDFPPCFYPANLVTIDYKGNLTLCGNDYHSSVILGNLNNEKLVDIWDKPVFKKIRRDLRKEKYNLPICKKCVGLA